jgi:hypothetical protein
MPEVMKQTRSAVLSLGITAVLGAYEPAMAHSIFDGTGRFSLSRRRVNAAPRFGKTSASSMVLSSAQQTVPMIWLDMWTLMATSGSACIVPQNVRLAGVDCEAISAPVSGRDCCQHTDARAVGKPSDIEGSFR